MNVKRCQKCGTAMSIQDTFCGNCGYRQQVIRSQNSFSTEQRPRRQEPFRAQANQSQDRIWRWELFLLIAIVVFVVLMTFPFP